MRSGVTSEKPSMAICDFMTMIQSLTKMLGNISCTGVHASPIPPEQCWNTKFCFSSIRTPQHWMVGKGEVWLISKGFKLANIKRAISLPQNLRKYGISMKHFSKNFPTNFVKDCVREVEKKSSKFRFLPIKQKLREIAQPKLDQLIIIIISIYTWIFMIVDCINLGTGQ